MLNAVGLLEAVRFKPKNMPLSPSPLFAGPYDIHQVLMSPDPGRGKSCYQNASFSHSPDRGCPPRRLEALASDQDGHAFDGARFGLVWRLPYLASRPQRRRPGWRSGYRYISRADLWN